MAGKGLGANVGYRAPSLNPFDYLPAQSSGGVPAPTPSPSGGQETITSSMPSPSAYTTGTTPAPSYGGDFSSASAAAASAPTLPTTSALSGLTNSISLSGGGSGAAPATAAASPATDALASIAPSLSLAASSSDQPITQQVPGQPSGASILRQNLGNRLYPQESTSLAGLKRAY